ncbi:MAG: hypothetical protein IH597_02985, partial [Bacteroidales bacterium]|nr:hypothetical protein [Bacteroidales bacterium]
MKTVTFNATLLLFLSLSLWSLNLVQAQTLNLSSFSTNGTVNVMVEDDDNIYIGGSFSQAGSRGAGIALVDNNGKVIPEFNSLAADVNAIIPDGSGGWYVGGSFSNIQGKNQLLHILPDNTINPVFSPAPNSTVQSLYLHGSTLYVGGWFTQIGGQPRTYLAALNATSGAATSWNPVLNSAVYSIQRNADIVSAGGTFTLVNGRSHNYFAMLDANTAELVSIMAVNSTVHAIEQDADNIYLGGSFSGAQGLLSRYGALLGTGSDLPENNFPILNSTVHASIPDGAGGWYVGGSFSGVGGKNYLIRVLANNTVDPTFSPAPNSTVLSLFLHGSTLYVGGWFTQIGGQPRTYLAALDAGTGVATSWAPNPNSIVNSISRHNNT